MTGWSSSSLPRPLLVAGVPRHGGAGRGRQRVGTQRAPAAQAAARGDARESRAQSGSGGRTRQGRARGIPSGGASTITSGTMRPRGATAHGDAEHSARASVRTHDAVTSRWLEYELDVAKIIAFPAMSDGRQPLTAAFLRAKRSPTGCARRRPRRGCRRSSSPSTAMRWPTSRSRSTSPSATPDAFWRLELHRGRAQAARHRQEAADRRHRRGGDAGGAPARLPTRARRAQRLTASPTRAIEVLEKQGDARDPGRRPPRRPPRRPRERPLRHPPPRHPRHPFPPPLRRPWRTRSRPPRRSARARRRPRRRRGRSRPADGDAPGRVTDPKPHRRSRRHAWRDAQPREVSR